MKTICPSGIVTPLLTPIHPDESVNYEQLARLIDHVVTGGVDAIFVMGSSGEFARFSPEVRARVVAEAVRLVGGRVPVYAGVSDAGLVRVKEHVRLAEKAGADVLVATLPYYFPIRNDEEAWSFFQGVCDATGLPVMLYNIPSTCGADIGFAVLDRLFDRKNVVGVKDSGGDAGRIAETIRRYKNKGKDFSVLVGAEELSFEGFKLGADGLVPSLSNPFPRLFADLYAAACGGDEERLRRLCDVVTEMNALNRYCNAWMAPNVWRKKALSHMGVCDEYCTMPHVPVDDATDVLVRRTIERYRSMYGEEA